MKKISSLEYNSLAWFTMRASLVGITMTMVITVAKQDSWLCGVLGIIIGAIPVAVFIALRNFNDNMNISQITEYAFGKFGKIISIILIIGAFIFVQTIFSDLVYFIRSQFLYKTSSIIIAIVFIIPLIYGLLKGLNTFAKTSLILFYVIIFTILFITFGLLGGINLDNLKPMFTAKPTSLLYGSIMVVGYNVLPLFLLLAIPKCRIENYKIGKSVLFYILAILAVINAVFLTISVYGVNLSLLFEYPEFQLLKKVAIGEVIGKLESILSMEWIVAFFILILVGLYFITTMIKETFKLKEKTNKGVIVAVCLLLLIINPYIFTMNGEANDALKGPILIMVYIIFFFIPLFILAAACIKAFLQSKWRRKQSSPQSKL